MSEVSNTEKNAMTDVENAVEEKACNSFKCVSNPQDKRIFLIALLTAVITVTVYHLVLVAIDNFCPEEELPVYCACHRTVCDDDDDDAGKKAHHEGRKKGGKRGEFLRKLSPEMREKVKNMSPEERREFFGKLRKQKKDGVPRPERKERPRKGRNRKGNAEIPVQE